MFAQQLSRATQAAVYQIAQAYGFQQFNLCQTDGQVWVVTATAGLAANQLVALLRDAILRRSATYGTSAQHSSWLHTTSTGVDDWQAAICDVHKEYFEEYELWVQQLCLPHPEEWQMQRTQQQQGQQQQRPRRQQQQQLPPGLQVAQKLLELSLQFCIYSEAANLRHTPHVLFLIYYIMRGSTTFGQVFNSMVSLPQGCQAGQPYPPSYWLFWVQQKHDTGDGSNFRPASQFPAAAILQTPAAPSASTSSNTNTKQPHTTAEQGQQQPQQAPGNILAGACDLTHLKCSLVQQLYDACPAAFKGPSAAAAAANMPNQQRQGETLQAAKDQILARLDSAGNEGAWQKAWVRQLLDEITSPSCVMWLKHQQKFLRLVVQPLFYFLAEQIDLAGQQAEEEPALRIAYCDVDESACSPAAVYGLIKALQDRKAADLWQALQEVVAPAPANSPQPDQQASRWKRLFGGRRHIAQGGRYPHDAARLEMLDNLGQVLPAGGPGGGSRPSQDPSDTEVTLVKEPALDNDPASVDEVYAIARRGADWWAAHLFKHKTYVEARSIANPFVAFWRVYAFHAVLLTAMAAVAYVWHEKPAGGTVAWVRLLAALLLPTVTDALLRVGRAGAHALLIMYRSPVRRKVGKQWKTLDPFPPGGWAIFMGKLFTGLLWLCWASVLAFAVVPVLIDAPLSFLPALDTLLRDMYLWLVAPLAHIIFIWGDAALCQRAGYTTSLLQSLQTKYGSKSRAAAAPGGDQGLKAALTAVGRSGAHAGCAADPAIDALFFPASNLEIDRQRSWWNAAMWVLVLLLKVLFEYPLVVSPLIHLMVQVMNTRSSYLSGALGLSGNEVVSTVGHATTLVGLAVPVILLSFSDTGLFFSLVGAAVSSITGFRRAVGSIKTWPQMVFRFEALLQCYKDHCMSRSAVLLHLQTRDKLDVQEVCMSALSSGWNALVLDLRQRDLLSNRELACLTFEELQLTHEQKHKLRTLPHVGQLGLTTVLPARCFLTGAVPELASGALGSAHHLWVGRMCWGWLLWICWQTGLLYNRPLTKNDGSAEAAQWNMDRQREAVENLKHLTALQLLHPPRARAQIERWQQLLTEAVNLLKLLSSSSTSPSNTAAAAAAVVDAAGLPRGAAAAKAGMTGLLHGVPEDDRAQRKAWRDLSHCVHRLLTLLSKELESIEKIVSTTSSAHSTTGSGFVSSLFGRRNANITSYECKEANNALKALRQRWEDLATAAAAEAVSRQSQRFSMQTQRFKQDQDRQRLQVLERIEQTGAASEGVPQVVRWLTDVLTMYEGDTVPADDEAVRFILNFASSLNDPGLGTAPSVHAMPSMTTLVPHYDEDVLYALSESDALSDLSIRDPSQLRADGKAKMVYLLQPDGSSTPTLSYLRSVYSTPGQTHTQWNNFVERIKGLAAAKGLKNVPAQINEYHFLPGCPLHSLKNELLLWASWRGQLLARTVRGLMTYRTALATLADFENPVLRPSAQPQGPDYDSLVQQRQQLLQLKEQEQQRLASLQQQQGLGWQQQQVREGIQQQLAQYEQQLQQIEQHKQTQLLANEVALAALRSALLEDLVDCKYNLVVSSQNFGVFASPKESSVNMKAAWLVHSIHLLRQQHPAFKVAFIDKQLLVTASRPGHKLELFRQASVLLATERQHKLAKATGVPLGKEAYRVLLPLNFESGRGVVLGEGKPENQNHAVIFCPGEALQTIDCNQDSIVAEGLKLRNLLAQFLPQGWDTAHLHARPTLTQALRQTTLRFMGIKPPKAASGTAAGATGTDNASLLQLMPRGKGRVALVGFREWIFSEDSGALAEFAAATERSFGTTVQRLMYNPGACRFHYGHPDVWRRSFVSTCGGVSKANKSLHVSEDVFGGYNVMLRGRDITYVDFIAAGKGRDMGFETINTFEAKIAAGNGEQVLSREVRRLAHNMDFARLLTWYHTGNGFFINTAITMVSVHASLWAYLLLALDKSSNPEVQKYLSTMQLLQLGTLSVLVYMFTLALEVGVFHSVFTVLRQMLQGSLMFFIFRSQTSAYSFTYDLLFGGAKYLATGRGYKLAPTSFKELYRRFGRSHFYFGAVLLQYCITCIAAGHLKGVGLLVLWAPFLVVVSLLFGPFWFTPFAFRTKTVSDDFDQVQKWFMSPSPKPENSWQSWNSEFWRAAANASGKQLGRFGAILRAHMFKLPTFVMVLAAVDRMKTQEGSKLPKWAMALVLGGGILLVIGVMLTARVAAARTAMKSQAPRVINLVATLLLAVGIGVSGWATSGESPEKANSFSNVCLALFGTVLMLRLWPLVHYNPLLGHWATDIANTVYYVADMILAYFLNGLRYVLSLFDILTGLQAQLLFNTSFARQVMADQSLEYSKLPELIKDALKLKREMGAQQRAL